jgi:hypothetical protein
MQEVNIFWGDKKVAGPFESHEAAEAWLNKNGYHRSLGRHREPRNILWEKKDGQIVEITS